HDAVHDDDEPARGPLHALGDDERSRADGVAGRRPGRRAGRRPGRGERPDRARDAHRGRRRARGGGARRDTGDRDLRRDGPRRGGMSRMVLANCRVGAAIAVSDMTRARDFYENRLGLVPMTGHEPPDNIRYACGEGTLVHVFTTPNAGSATSTVAGWEVADIEA